MSDRDDEGGRARPPIDFTSALRERGLARRPVEPLEQETARIDRSIAAGDIAASLVYSPALGGFIVYVHPSLNAAAARVAATIALTRGRMLKYMHTQAGFTPTIDGVSYPSPIDAGGPEAEILAIVQFDELTRRERDLVSLNAPEADAPA